MKPIILLLIILLSLGACATTYNVEIRKLDGTIVKAESRSFREFALFKMDYNPATGAFSLNAVGVTDDTAEVVTQAVSTAGAVAVPYLGGLPVE